MSTDDEDTTLTTTENTSLETMAATINAEHEAAQDAARSALEHAFRAGDLLLAAKEQVRHREWLPWLREHCTVPERTAQAYMRLTRGRDQLAESATVADLTVREATALLTEPRPTSGTGLWHDLVTGALAAAETLSDHLQAIGIEQSSEWWRAVRSPVYTSLDTDYREAMEAVFSVNGEAIESADTLEKAAAVAKAGGQLARAAEVVNLRTERLAGRLIIEMNEAQPGHNVGTKAAAAEASL